MTTTETVSVPSLPVDPDKLGYFRFGRVAGGVLVTNEFGEWHHFDEDGFRRFLAGDVDEDAPEREALDAKSLLRDDIDLDHVAGALRRRKRFVGVGPALHVVPLSDVHGALTVETAKDIIDFAMLSTATAIEYRLVAQGAPDADLMGFIVQYATEKNRYEGKAITFRLVADLATLDDELVTWLVDKRFKVRTTLPDATVPDEITGTLSKLNEAAAAKKRDGWSVEFDVPVHAGTLAAVATLPEALASHGIRSFRLHPATGGDDAVDVDAWRDIYTTVVDACVGLDDGPHEELTTTLLTRTHRTDPSDDVTVRSPSHGGRVAYDTKGGIYPSPAARDVDDPDMFRLGVAGETSYKDVTTHPTMRALAVASLLECLPGFAHHWAAPYLGVDPLTAWSDTGDLFHRAPTSAAVAMQVAALEVLFERLLGDDEAKAEALRAWVD